MSVPAGRYMLGPEQATLVVNTRKGGAAAKAGHDLSIEVGAWSAELEIADDPARSRLTLSADSRSLKVIEGTGGIQSLGEDDKAGITQTIDEEVLKGGTIRFQSSSATPSPDGGAITVAGELELLGTRAPLSFELQVDGGHLVGSATIKQTTWGIKPYSAMWGALKVLDDVVVSVDGTLPAG